MVTEDPSASASILLALHHGGLWSLVGYAPAHGLPTDTLRIDISSGFIIGMHIAAIASAALSALVVTFIARTLGPQGALRPAIQA